MVNAVTLELSPQTLRYLRQAERNFGRQQLYEALLPVMDRIAARAAGFIVKTQMTGQAITPRTGNLRRAVTGRSELLDGAPAIRVGIFSGPALQYAGIQEFGTKGKNPQSPYNTIVPVTAGALAIPVNDSLTPAGVPRYASPRNDTQDLEFVPYGRGVTGTIIGGLYEREELAKLEGNDELTTRDLTPSWLLATQVDLPPRYYLRNGMQAYLPTIAEELGEFLKAYVSGTGGN